MAWGPILCTPVIFCQFSFIILNLLCNISELSLHGDKGWKKTDLKTKLKRFLLPSICCSIKPLLGWIRRNQPEWKHFVSSGTRDWAVEMPGGESLSAGPVSCVVMNGKRSALSMWSWVTGRWTWCESLYQAREPDRQWGFGCPCNFSLIWPLCCSRGQLGLSSSGLRQWRTDWNMGSLG